MQLVRATLKFQGSGLYRQLPVIRRNVLCEPKMSLTFYARTMSNKPRKNIENLKNKLDETYKKYTSKSFQRIVTQLKTGVSAEYNNAKVYWRLRDRSKAGTLSKFANYQEIMSVVDFKRDGIKSMFVLFIAVAPMGFWFLWIPIVLFPRRLFPRSFWSMTQKKNFYKENYADRSQHVNVISHHFNYHKTNWELDDNAKALITRTSNGLRDQGVITNKELLRLKPLFRNFPFDLDLFDSLLLKSFCKIFEINSIGPETILARRLRSMATDVLAMDYNLRRKNLNTLSAEEVMDANYIRGVNASVLSHEANLYWLKNWVKLTSQCGRDDASFVLHAMVFHSTNYTQLKYQRSAFS